MRRPFYNWLIECESQDIYFCFFLFRFLRVDSHQSIILLCLTVNVKMLIVQKFGIYSNSLSYGNYCSDLGILWCRRFSMTPAPRSSLPSQPLRSLREAFQRTARQMYEMMTNGSKEFYQNTRLALNIRWNVPKEHRNWKQLHFLEQNKQDWLLSLPFIFVLLLPGSFLYLPPIVAIYPNFLPSTFQIPEFKQKRFESIMDRRLRTTPYILRSINQIANERLDSKAFAQQTASVWLSIVQKVSVLIFLYLLMNIHRLMYSRFP
jgi:hypothetical protein